MLLNKENLIVLLKKYTTERPTSFDATMYCWADFLGWLDKEYEADIEQTCPSCKGRGWLRGQGMMVKCRGCDGTGERG